jgi:DNA-binding transcriptional LysR family regulator
MNYTLRQLQYFVAAADHGSVAGAARALNISQPSISTAIAKLEALLGVRLLLRHHAHGVSLTPAGLPLLAEARSLLAHAVELAEHARGLGESVSGRLDVGCFVTIAPSFFPAIARGFTETHPEVDIRLHEGHQDELLSGLASGRFTVALLYDFDLAGDLDLQPLADLAPYALLPGDHPLARRRKVALAELAPLPMVLLDMPPSRDYFTSLFLKCGLKPDIRFRSPSFETVRGMVGNGVGYSLLVTRPASDLSYDGRPLACRPLADDVEPGRVVLARLSQSRPTRLVESFADYCRTYFAEGAGR